MATMYDSWDYANPVRLLFGAGRLDELPAVVRGRRALLVTTAGFTARGVTDRVRDLLLAPDLCIFDAVQPNPDLYDIQQACRLFLDQPIAVVIGLGGGSALDTAKAMSFVLSAGDPDVLQQHFVANRTLPDVSPYPVIAVPTTAGTGSEVTPFATIWDKQQQKKYSLARPNLYAEAALLDPALTLSLPREVTISTGLDALSQAFEAIWNRNATPITTVYAERAIALVLDVLPRLVDALDDLALRVRMMEASLLAGLAISRTRTALAHSMSYPITARYDLPHGFACSFTLPTILDFNAVVDDGRLSRLANGLGYRSVAALREALTQFLLRLDVDATLRSYVPGLDEVVTLAQEMLTPGRADNTMRAVTTEDVVAILRITTQLYSDQTTNVSGT